MLVSPNNSLNAHTPLMQLRHQSGVLYLAGEGQSWRSPSCKGTLVPLPGDKLLLPCWIRPDLGQLFSWHASTWTWEGWMDVGKGYWQCCCHWYCLFLDFDLLPSLSQSLKFSNHSNPHSFQSFQWNSNHSIQEHWCCQKIQIIKTTCSLPLSPSLCVCVCGHSRNSRL